MDLYDVAAEVLQKFNKKQGSVKNLVFSSNYKNVRQLYALVCESLKYQEVMSTIFDKCSGLLEDKTLTRNRELAIVLLYEHLVGKGLRHAGSLKRICIMRHKKEVKEACSQLMQEQGVDSLALLLSGQSQMFNNLPIPRYVRVNLLKTTVDDVKATFEEEGWIWHGQLTLNNFRAEVEGLCDDKFALDPLMPDLLVFPPATELHAHHLTNNGSIVLQDRASCFPAHVLNPPSGATVLDCCAAPGNKTSHIASLLGNSGRVLAYERDVKRMSLLQKQLQKTGVTNTTTKCQDFLSVDPHDPSFANVEFILVDPSCSGSGMLSRMDHLSSTTCQRLENLARFQVSILKHALRFSSVRRVVYSTCSINEEENEQVVAEVAWQVKDQFHVQKIFPMWPHRGQGSSPYADCCIRMSPKDDLTNGFFVACFEKTEKSATLCQEASAKKLKKRKQRRKDGMNENMHKKKKLSDDTVG